MTQYPHKPDIRKANSCPPCPNNASIWDKLVYWLGIGLGSGLPKRAAGTWGTAGGLLIAIPLMTLGFVPFLLITLCAAIFGIYCCGRTSALMSVHDDPHIVWDEWVGMWVTLLPLFILPQALTEAISLWLLLPAAFVLFRLFDIIKPPPIGWADKKLAGGLGIMIDDLIAAVMAAAVLVGLVYFYHYIITTFLAV